MGDSHDATEPGDDVDWVSLYVLRPNLWSDYLDELESALEEDRAEAADLVRFMEKCLQSVRCLSDVHAQLPGLGLTLAQFVAIRETAMAAELAAVERDSRSLSEKETVPGKEYEARIRPVGAGPLSRELVDAIINLHLRGLDHNRIACAFGIHSTWPSLAVKRARLHAGAQPVIKAHLEGKTLAEISKATGVAPSSALRILRQVGEKPNGAGARTDARARARTIVKLRAQGLEYKEIARRVGCSIDVVKNALRRDRRHRYGTGRAAE